MPATETLNAGFHDPSKNFENICFFNLLLIDFSIFSQFACFCFLHSFDQISQKLMWIFLSSKFELHNVNFTFLNMLFKWLIMELGAKLLTSLVWAYIFSISQNTHHWLFLLLAHCWEWRCVEKQLARDCVWRTLWRAALKKQVFPRLFNPPPIVSWAMLKPNNGLKNNIKVNSDINKLGECNEL